jgi:hypothetical protein
MGLQLPREQWVFGLAQTMDSGPNLLAEGSRRSREKGGMQDSGSQLLLPNPVSVPIGPVADHREPHFEILQSFFLVWTTAQPIGLSNCFEATKG